MTQLSLSKNFKNQYFFSGYGGVYQEQQTLHQNI